MDKNDDHALLQSIPSPNLFLTGKFQELSIIEPEENLTLAGDPRVDFFNTAIEGGHEDALQRATAAIVYFRRHQPIWI